MSRGARRRRGQQRVPERGGVQRLAARPPGVAAASRRGGRRGGRARRASPADAELHLEAGARGEPVGPVDGAGAEQVRVEPLPRPAEPAGEPVATGVGVLGDEAHVHRVRTMPWVVGLGRSSSRASSPSGIGSGAAPSRCSTAAARSMDWMEPGTVSCPFDMSNSLRLCRTLAVAGAAVGHGVTGATGHTREESIGMKKNPGRRAVRRVRRDDDPDPVRLGVVAQVVTPRGALGDHDLISWAWGIGVTLGVYVAARLSGAHLNPAVTLALAAFKGFAWRKVRPTSLAQTARRVRRRAHRPGHVRRPDRLVDPGHTTRPRASSRPCPATAAPASRSRRRSSTRSSAPRSSSS